jgi:hypothetical protein
LAHAFPRKGRDDDGVVMAMLFCGEHVENDEYGDALPAVVKRRLGLVLEPTGRA